MERRTNEQRHLAASQDVRRAIWALRAALVAESGLEWSGRLEEAMRDLDDIDRGLIRYARGRLAAK